jgi:hypothetical protein
MEPRQNQFVLLYTNFVEEKKSNSRQIGYKAGFMEISMNQQMNIPRLANISRTQG